MELKILVSDLKPILFGNSHYNYNYYELPININGCDILLGVSDDDYTTVWQLGKFVNDEFERDCWLGESSIFNSDVEEYIDLLEANTEMIWY